MLDKCVCIGAFIVCMGTYMFCCVPSATVSWLARRGTIATSNNRLKSIFFMFLIIPFSFLLYWITSFLTTLPMRT